MLIGLLLIGGVCASGYGLYKLDKNNKEAKQELDRIKRENERRAFLASTSNTPVERKFDWEDSGRSSNYTERTEYHSSEKPKTKKVYRSNHGNSSNSVHETHTTTVVNNYHDVDDGSDAFTGAMLGTMVGNAMTQPVMPVAPAVPLYAPSPVYVEPSAPEVIQVPPEENDGGSDVEYDGNDSESSSDTSSWNNTNSNDGGSDVSYDGNDSSSDWGSSSSDSSSDTSSWGDSGGGSDFGGDSSW